MQSNATILKAYGILDSEEHLYKPIMASEVKYISPHIGVRKILEDERITLTLVIDGDTGIDEFEKCWNEIIKVRDELQNNQGIEVNDYFREILRQIFEKDYIREYKIPAMNGAKVRPVKSSPSYRELVMDANFDLLTFLVGIFKEPENSNIRKLSEHLFRSLLTCFKFSNVDINEFKKDGLEKIRLGHCPWDITKEPINKSKMREKIRYLRELFKGQEASLKLYDSKKALLSVLNLYLRKNYWIEANELLKATFKENYTYESRWNARTIEITSYNLNK